MIHKKMISGFRKINILIMVSYILITPAIIALVENINYFELFLAPLVAPIYSVFWANVFKESVDLMFIEDICYYLIYILALFFFILSFKFYTKLKWFVTWNVLILLATVNLMLIVFGGIYIGP